MIGCRWIYTVVVLLLLGAWCGRASAWSRTGHHVVANLAYDALDAETRKKAVELLRHHPRFRDDFTAPASVVEAGETDRWCFAFAAEWPDEVRSLPASVRRKYAHDTWHYINQPFFLTEFDRKVLEKEIKPNLARALPEKLEAARDPEELNVVQAIKLCQARLKDPQVGKERKAVYLCWLMHLVGDVHQPMHAATLYSRGRFHERSGDRNGNGIPTLKGNLHGFWDALLGRAQLNGIGDLNTVRKRSEEILGDAELKQAAARAADDLDPDHWLDESYQLATTFAYCPPVLDAVKQGETREGRLAVTDLPLEYRQQAGRHAQRRIGAAGQRLAKLLQESLK
ncbi:MAG: S1/P1 nuclease [Gemmataceae bacterium]